MKTLYIINKTKGTLGYIFFTLFVYINYVIIFYYLILILKESSEVIYIYHSNL